MPTIASQPSLKSTRAVGAILLHQFARERFLEAGLDEALIKEAESSESVEDLAAVLLDDEDDIGDSICSSQADRQPLNNSYNSNSSINGADNTANLEYHSITESASNSYTNGNDTTAYHSINGTQTTASIVDRVQSIPVMASYGREFRRLAEEFERDRLRKTVKSRAEQVKLTDITKEGFLRLLEELFQDKITRERIVILFFFCTDVALRAASFAQELVVKLMGWSFSYIINSVCDAIHNFGGWDKLLFYQIPSLLISCCAALAICSMIVYLRKSSILGS